ncbi:sulfurtransferase, partial [Haematococcus lacustris]
MCRLGQPDIKILDGSWYLPPQGRDGQVEYRSARIPGALFFDVERICDLCSSLPHMLPPAPCFAAAMDALGIRNQDTVVVYDGMGVFSAPR